MLDSTARMIGTVGIWASFAIVMAAGMCRMNWNGDSAEFTFVVASAMICSAAAVSTFFIWRTRPVPNPLSAGDQPVI
jgi:hypothetical protein